MGMAIPRWVQHADTEQILKNTMTRVLHDGHVWDTTWLHNAHST